jgi:hypothetical protein
VDISRKRSARDDIFGSQIPAARDDDVAAQRQPAHA